MNYILKRRGRFYYNRRIPSEFREFDSRKFVCIALKTYDPKEAIHLASVKNKQVEQYWHGLACTGQSHNLTLYERAVKRSGLLGFSYTLNEQLALEPLNELYKRLIHVKQEGLNKHHADAVMGIVSEPEIKLSDALARFFEYSKNKLTNKTPDQIRKWKNPRKRAIRYFIRAIGNKDVTKITRDDTLKFRDWWIKKIDEDDLLPGTANKNIIHTKSVLKTVKDNLKLNLDINHLFTDLTLEEFDDDETRKPPFSTEHLISVLLKPENLEEMELQARYALYAFSETGAGSSELVGLLPEDIKLNCDIPHIVIKRKEKYWLKNKYRRRIIPLVGFALDAFKACPNGFTDYLYNPDKLSSTWGMYLKSKPLLPTEEHTANSLRHSFQDRLLAANAPDLVQADLMGHKFERPNYGDGASLQQKLEWLKKIQLKSQVII